MASESLNPCSAVHADGYRCGDNAGHTGPHGASVGRGFVVWGDEMTRCTDTKVAPKGGLLLCHRRKGHKGVCRAWDRDAELHVWLTGDPQSGSTSPV